MLRFAVYDNEGPSTDFRLIGAHLLGPNDQPISGGIELADGCIVCKSSAPHAVALALPYSAGRMGRLLLQTCLLPARNEPYMLTVELARHRIKTFIAKSEEWQMFDLSSDHPAMQLWEQARLKLTAALIQQDPVKAHHLGEKSLELGIEASEKLAMAHAEILLHRRYVSRAASSSTLGVRVWPGRNSSKLREIIARDFDVVVVPILWKHLEVDEGRFDWESTDRLIHWAKSVGKPVIAGPLLDFSRHAVPDWLYVWQHDYETCRELAYNYMEQVIRRYHNVVNIWNVASGLNLNDNFRFKDRQMLDLTRMAGLLVRQIKRSAKVLIELVQPFGEFSAENAAALAPMMYLDRIVQEGIRFDCLGVQILFGHAGEGRIARDLMQVSSLLDRFFLLELPVLISAVGVPNRTVSEDGGWWHEPWTDDVQKEWLAKFFWLAMSKPFVESVCLAELYDHDAALLEGAGMISAQGRAKPALAKLAALRRRLRKPLGPLQLPPRTAAPPTTT